MINLNVNVSYDGRSISEKVVYDIVNYVKKANMEMMENELRCQHEINSAQPKTSASCAATVHYNNGLNS